MFLIKKLPDNEPDVVSVSDYYPFGMQMPGRLYSEPSNSYRFGYNTQEKTDEVAGTGNHYTAQYWEYNPQVVQRWNLDPKPNPAMSFYATFAGNPIINNDILGDTSMVIVSGTISQKKKTTNRKEEYQGYQLSVYKNMTIERYNKLKDKNKLPEANYVTYVGRDAHYMKRKVNKKSVEINHSENRYGSNNETPPGEYFLFLSGTNGDNGGGRYQLYIGDENGNRKINGPDGSRSGIALHGWDPRFSQGCLTTFQSGSKGGVQSIIDAIPDLNDDSQPVKMIIEPRPVILIQKSDQIIRQGIPYEVPYRIDEF